MRDYVRERISAIVAEVGSRPKERKPPTRKPLRERVAASARAADAWTPPAVELLTLAQIRALPQTGASRAHDQSSRRAGVYFLWSGEQLVYVGVSESVYDRVFAHRGYSCATFLAVPWPWCLAFEALYIEAYRPPLNLRR